MKGMIEINHLLSSDGKGLNTCEIVLKYYMIGYNFWTDYRITTFGILRIKEFLNVILMC